jgi:hypothetical protein
MEATVTDAIALVFMVVIVVLAASATREAWSEPGASRFSANLRRGLPYLGDREARALCRAMPSVVVAAGGLTVGFACSIAIAFVEEGSGIAVFAGVVALAALAILVIAGILAVAAAVFARPQSVIPPPFREPDLPN